MMIEPAVAGVAVDAKNAVSCNSGKVSLNATIQAVDPHLVGAFAHMQKNASNVAIRCSQL